MTGPQPIPKPTRVTEQARLALATLPLESSLSLVFSTACELAANALEVERVGVWLFVDDRSALCCACLFERSRKELSSGTILRVADFPRYFSSLSLRKAIPAEFAATDVWTAELAEAYLRPLGISSMLDAGIFVEGNLVGVVCHEQVGPPKEWTTEARDFAGSVADLIAMRIQSAQANELRTAFRTQKGRLAHLQKVAALEQIAAGVAHDFGNLLEVIIGKAELIGLQESLSAETVQDTSDIIQAAERGLTLMKEMSEFSRPSKHPPTVLDLAAVATEFLPLLRSAVGRNHEVRLESQGSPGQVLMDRTQYTRILLNLALNARDAMPQSGVVVIRLASVRLTIGSELAGCYALTEVSDTGMGMDDETKKQAFDPFFTTKKDGTGMGLAIVQRMADQNGGLVRIESTVGKGTTVQVFLPRVGASPNGTTELVVSAELRSLRDEG